jgi:hypothetical protein
MVQLTEVLDEEFMREQEGPHDEDEWDTDSGKHHFPATIAITQSQSIAPLSYTTILRHAANIIP